MKKLIRLLPLLLLAFRPAISSGEDGEPFSVVLDYLDRLEFYQPSGFGPTGGDCSTCQTPFHPSCNRACYTRMPSLTLVCNATTHAASIGPFDRKTRNELLAGFYQTDRLLILTDNDEDALLVSRITSVADDNEPDYSIDLEGIPDLRTGLSHAMKAYQAFSVKIGTQEYTIPLNGKIQSALGRFIRQCPG